MPYSIKFAKKIDAPAFQRAVAQVRTQLRVTAGVSVVSEALYLTNDWKAGVDAFKQAAQQSQPSLHFEQQDLEKQNPGNKHWKGTWGMIFGLSSNPHDCDRVAVIDSNPVRKVFYTPFPCMFNDCEKAADQRAGYAALKTGQLQSPATQPLAPFGGDIIVYVVCHGDHVGGEASCDCKKCGSAFYKQGLTAYELKDRMENDGLSHDVRELRLWACKGADKPSPGAQSFAEIWANFFDKADYPRAQVFGYTGFLVIASDMKKYSYGVRDVDSTKRPATQAKQGPLARP